MGAKDALFKFNFFHISSTIRIDYINCVKSVDQAVRFIIWTIASINVYVFLPIYNVYYIFIDLFTFINTPLPN